MPLFLIISKKTHTLNCYILNCINFTNILINILLLISSKESVRLNYCTRKHIL